MRIKSMSMIFDETMLYEIKISVVGDNKDYIIKDIKQTEGKNIIVIEEKDESSDKNLRPIDLLSKLTRDNIRKMNDNDYVFLSNGEELNKFSVYISEEYYEICIRISNNKRYKDVFKLEN